MATPLAIPQPRKGNLGRSISAVVVAILANVVLSLGVDQVFHVIGVYPPWGAPMREPALNLLALGYRLVFGVAAGYIVARLAPSAPKRHATILGVIATALATIGAITTIPLDLGPAWYPIALAVLSYPTVRLGAALYLRT